MEEIEVDFVKDARCKHCIFFDTQSSYCSVQYGIVGENFSCSQFQFDENKKRQEEIRENKRREQLQQFIFDNKLIPQLIDHAIGKLIINGQELRYFGSKLYQEIMTKKGLIKIETEVIVTEDRFIYSLKSRPANCNFEFKTIMNLKSMRWDKNNINLFVKGEIADITYAEAFEEQKKIYEKYMVYENELTYKFNAIRNLLTYHWDLLDKFLIKKVEGQSGTAKSKDSKLFANLAFNGRVWIKPNPANFFRYRNANKSAIAIQEAEKLFDDSKKKQQGDDELVEYLNASYEKGNFVPRQNKENLNLTEEFDPSGFTDLGSIKPIKGALEKRSITLTMVTAKKNDPRADTEVPTESHPEFVEARNKAYISSLLNYKALEYNLKFIQNKTKLSNREWQLAKPIVALASCISEKLSEEMIYYLEKSFEVRDDSTFDQTSPDIILATLLIKLTCKKNEDSFLSNDLLKVCFNEEWLKQGSENRPFKVNSVSRLLTQLGLKDFRNRNTKGTERGLEINFFKLAEILLRNKKLTIQEIIKIMSEVSECQITDNKLTNWYSDTFSDRLDLNSVRENISDDTDTKDSSFEVGLSEKITAAIQSKDQGQGLSSQAIADILSLSVGSIYPELIKIKESGSLIEVRPDIWKVL